MGSSDVELSDRFIEIDLLRERVFGAVIEADLTMFVLAPTVDTVSEVIATRRLQRA